MFILACLLTLSSIDASICEEIKRELLHAVDYGSIAPADAEAIYNRCIQKVKDKRWLSRDYC